MTLTMTTVEFVKRPCGKCRKLHGDGGFYRDKGRKSGFTVTCRRCYKAYQTEYMKTPKYRENYLRRRYGMSVEDYDALWALQNCGCAICGATESGSSQAPMFVDHCHKSGVVRGLLCLRCNTSIGKFEDSPDLLRSAIQYLEKEYA